ncbi:site-2 protease family protein [Abyssisolibacter fermentans]|uniref:site-2 protease family protein n=1 Tax=Abyssisolibacter fermentans TaxID=1766203 RepID=UPI00082C641E|nr:site-2 protease family protein [Abyssisolibacter fermentans]
MSYVIIGYISLYTVIWLHEVGHAIMYKKYGCKKNAFKVNVPFYFAFSTPEPVNLDKLQKINLRQNFFVGIAGIVVNIVFGTIGFIIIKLFEFNTNSLFYFFLYSFTLFHFVEAATYMVINNIYVASDIVSVQNYKPLYRIPIFILGLVVTYIIVNLLISSEEIWKTGLIAITIITAFMMGVLRIVFSILNKKSKKVNTK